jgi:hypothetical protein
MTYQEEVLVMIMTGFVFGTMISIPFTLYIIG